MFGLGMQEMVIVMVVAVLLFGKRLPDVARSLGGSYHQFRKGLQDIQSEVNATTSSYQSSSTSAQSGNSTFDDEDYDEPTAPKFEAPPSESWESEPSEETAASEPSEIAAASEPSEETAASQPSEQAAEAPARAPSEETA